MCSHWDSVRIAEGVLGTGAASTVDPVCDFLGQDLKV